ncbi:hypothetical protein [Pseudomonas sp. NPDC096950]|uniref:hypothetical protein n=1 Tax=Pseudomonas sp. NPDC096950 TaxID=3364485 RepID=UPI00383A31CC
MSQKKTRIPLPHPPPYRESRITLWLMNLVYLLIACSAGLLGYAVVDGLIHGSISTMNRHGPVVIYKLAQQPRMYWFLIVWHSASALGLLALGAGAFWLHRIVLAAPDKPKRKRVRR